MLKWNLIPAASGAFAVNKHWTANYAKVVCTLKFLDIAVDEKGNISVGINESL